MLKDSGSLIANLMVRRLRGPMTTMNVSAEDLLAAMGRVLEVCKRLTPTDLSELLTLRFKSGRALTSFLDGVDERCATLRRGTAPQAERCVALQLRVATLRNRVSAHITRWNPAAIAADIQAYKDAVHLLQREMRVLISEAEGLPRPG
jgi:hypothetical protein